MTDSPAELADARAGYLTAQQALRASCGRRDKDSELHDRLADLRTAQLTYAEACAAAGTSPADDLALHIGAGWYAWREPGDAPAGSDGPREDLPSGVSFAYGVVPA